MFPAPFDSASHDIPMSPWAGHDCALRACQSARHFESKMSSLSLVIRSCSDEQEQQSRTGTPVARAAASRSHCGVTAALRSQPAFRAAASRITLRSLRQSRRWIALLRGVMQYADQPSCAIRRRRSAVGREPARAHCCFAKPRLGGLSECKPTSHPHYLWVIQRQS